MSDEPERSEADPAKDAEPQETSDELTELERGVLAIEKKRWRYQGSKEQAILKTLGINATRYYQILNALIDDPRAMKAEPQLINRLYVQRAL